MSSAILVVIGEHNWTRRALHLAGAMAHETWAREAWSRETETAVVILKLIPVQRLEYLGAGTREELLSYEEFDALRAYSAITAAYGVPVYFQQFEYIDYTGGLLSAAEQLSAVAVFAPAPGGFVAPVARLRLWWLRRVMGRPLYTLGEGDGALILPQSAGESASTVGRARVRL
jgi:hypothetical protein